MQTLITWKVVLRQNEGNHSPNAKEKQFYSSKNRENKAIDEKHKGIKSKTLPRPKIFLEKLYSNCLFFALVKSFQMPKTS